jgi:hypothetical protein
MIFVLNVIASLLLVPDPNDFVRARNSRFPLGLSSFLQGPRCWFRLLHN